MKKKVIDIEVAVLFDWLSNTEISKIKKDLDALEKLGATHIEFEPLTEYGISYLTVKAISRREETDEEFAQRIKATQEREEKLRRIELEQLERLKAKYGETS